MAERPKVLLITNHVNSANCAGQVDGLERLVVTGEIASLEVLHGQRPAERSQAEHDRLMVERVAASDADVLVVLSMGRRIKDMDSIATAVASRRVLYWEGDAWGRGKPVSREMSAWLQMADTVFSVSAGSQIQLLRRQGARRVVSTFNTYDQVLCADSERVNSWREATNAVVFLGGNTMRMPIVSGIPGAFQRFQTVRKLRRAFGEQLLLAGPGWPRSWSIGRVDYASQATFLKRGRVVAVWEHFPKVPGFSDRLPSAMIAGRPQVTTLYEQIPWAPGEQHGVVQMRSPSEVVRESRRIAGDESLAMEMGRAAHEWAKNRLSHAEAMRFIMSSAFDHVAPPPEDPWSHLQATQ